MEIDYKQKYLKYKEKYLLLKEQYSNKKKQKGGVLEYITLDEDNILFRMAPNIRELRTLDGRLRNARYCGDTGKTGLYFANKAIISLAMCLEYNRVENMELGVFRLTESINMSNDKYAFREINPERYFNENGEFIMGTDVLPEENISHVKCQLNLLKSNQELLLPDHIQDGISCLGSCEIFLSNQNDDLNKIEMLEAFKFNPALIRSAQDLLNYMERNHFPFEISKYIDDGILIPL